MMELPAVTIPTPAAATVVTTTVKRPLRNRIIAAGLAAGAFLTGLVQQLNLIDLAPFGLDPKVTAWTAAGLFISQWILLQFFTPISIGSVRAVPALENGR